MIGFYKIHGLGNNFIFLDETCQNLSHLKTKKTIKLLCNVRLGIGADGVVFISQPDDSNNHCKMEIFNSDGSEAEMCGNAIRCVGHLYNQLNLGVPSILVETKSGIRTVSPVGAEEGTALYKAQMGIPEFDLVKTNELVESSKQKELIWNEYDFKPIYVNVGNPHAVIFLNKKLKLDEIKKIGAWLETHSNHPKRINIEFVEIISRSEANMTVWERGCGITQACGTGSTAVAAAGIKTNQFDKKVTIHMPGGDLIIEQDENKIMYMTGPIQEVMTGQLSPSFVHQHIL